MHGIVACGKHADSLEKDASMGEINRFYAHGISTIVENPERLSEERRQSNFGFPRWRQRSGTSNWFHLPIPTPGKVDGNKIAGLFQITLQGQRDEGVEITEIHVRKGHELDDAGIIRNPAIPPNEPFSFDYGRHGSAQLMIRGRGPICLSVFAEWRSSTGFLRLYGGGAAWYKYSWS